MLAIVPALALPDLRRILVSCATRTWRPIAVVAAASVVALVPLVLVYSETASVVGMRDYAQLEPYVPGALAWVNLGSDSLLWGWLFDPEGLALVPETERLASIGALTALAALIGLSIRWRGAGGALLFVWLAVVLLATGWMPGLHPWRLVFELFPGASAIREVSRLAFIALVPAAAGVAFLLDRLQRRGLVWVAAGVALLLLAEQPRTMPSFDKAWSRRQVTTLAATVDPDRCNAFYYSPQVGPELSRAGPWYRLHWVRFQTDAMLAQLESGVPTLNGYTGNYPPGWRLDDPVVDGPDDLERIGSRLASWLAHNGLSEQGLCWVQLPVME